MQLLLKCLDKIGELYRAWGKYFEALTYYEKMLQILEMLDDQIKKRETLSKIGYIFKALGKYTEALDSFHQILQIDDTLGDQTNKRDTLRNIGHVYKTWRKYAEALDFYHQALRIDKLTGDKIRKSATLSNIDQIFQAWEKEARKSAQSYQDLINYRNKTKKRNTTLQDIRNIFWILFPPIALFLSALLSIFGTAIGNFGLCRITFAIMAIIPLFYLIAYFIVPDSIMRYPPHFRVKIKDQYQNFFKNPPSSYYLTACLILAFDMGIFILLSLGFCLENFSISCWIISIIFLFFFIAGTVLGWLGVILYLKRKSLPITEKNLELVIQAVFEETVSPVKLVQIIEDLHEDNYDYPLLTLKEVISWQNLVQKAKNLGWNQKTIKKIFWKNIKKGLIRNLLFNELKLSNNN